MGQGAGMISEILNDFLTRKWPSPSAVTYLLLLMAVWTEPKSDTKESNSWIFSCQ